jgi:hypothetical protein
MREVIERSALVGWELGHRPFRLRFTTGIRLKGRQYYKFCQLIARMCALSSSIHNRQQRSCKQMLDSKRLNSKTGLSSPQAAQECNGIMHIVKRATTSDARPGTVDGRSKIRRPLCICSSIFALISSSVISPYCRRGTSIVSLFYGLLQLTFQTISSPIFCPLN